MSENNTRTGLVASLLLELKYVYAELLAISRDMKKSSGTAYEKVLKDNTSHIEKEIELYRNNMGKISSLNTQITNEINSWYSFVKDPEQIKKLSYPLRYFFNRKKLNRLIKQINEKISIITIENRFIKEQLVLWEQRLETETVQLIKTGEDYEKYSRLVRKKDRILMDLSYLIPTIEGFGSLILDLDNIDAFIERFSKSAA